MQKSEGLVRVFKEMCIAHICGTGRYFAPADMLIWI